MCVHVHYCSQLAILIGVGMLAIFWWLVSEEAEASPTPTYRAREKTALLMFSVRSRVLWTLRRSQESAGHGL